MKAPLTRDRINDIVKRYRPKGWRIAESHHRWKWSSAEADDTKHVLRVPTLQDAESLFLYLHEVGHVLQRHFTIRPALPHHREEFEAEKFAMMVFRNEGIAVDRDILEAARVRVRGAIERDERRGVKISFYVARWANRQAKEKKK